MTAMAQLHSETALTVQFPMESPKVGDTDLRIGAFPSHKQELIWCSTCAKTFARLSKRISVQTFLGTPIFAM